MYIRNHGQGKSGKSGRPQFWAFQISQKNLESGAKSRIPSFYYLEILEIPEIWEIWEIWQKKDRSQDIPMDSNI